MTRVLFQNHSSLLLEKDGLYLLTDPWFETPAFGSWLPSLPPYIHPSFLAALGDKLVILISHGHDDHFDDQLLEIFSKETTIVTAKFKAPSVIKRLQRLGFENVTTVDETGSVVRDTFHISSYIVQDFSHDDATYLITTEDGAVIHANDNWHEFTDEHHEKIQARCAEYTAESILLFSQTNSASGYPLNYRNFNDDEKIEVLKKKVANMVQGGLRNAERLGLSRMFSYAGYATAYVKDKPYDKQGLLPTANMLTGLLDEVGVKSPVKIEDMYPGDFVSLPSGAMTKAFLTGYEDAAVKASTDRFYDVYDKKSQCLSRRTSAGSVVESRLELFLEEFNKFATRRVEGADAHYTDLPGKSFKIVIDRENTPPLVKHLKFGTGLIDSEETANKTCYVDEVVMASVLTGDAIFEDLYTGYNAEWERHPGDIYNRDIVMMLVMFSYVYKNRLLPQLQKAEA